MEDEISDDRILGILGTWGALPLLDGSPEEIIRGRERILVLAIRQILAVAKATQ